MEMSFFAEMAWKSALIAGAALMLATLLRSRAAADRAMVLKLGVAMLLALPLIVLFAPALEIVAFAAPEPSAAPAAAPLAEWQLAALAGELPPAPAPSIWDDPTPLILLAWLGGLAMIGARLVAGLWTLRRWTRGARDVTCPEWLAAFDKVRWQADNATAIRLLVADEVRSPLSWGWRRPAILIDPDTLGDAGDAEAILAHEIAHIARGDWPALLLARTARALFWFNPLVWLLEREILQQAEEAADLEAAERIEPARYAETLLSWARFNTMVPANGIAPKRSALGRRVHAILDRRSRERPAGSAWTGIAMVMCLSIAAPVAAAKLVADAQEPPAAPPAPQAPAAPAAPPSAAFVAPEALAAPAAPVAPEAPAAPDIAEVRIAPVPPVPPMPPIPDIGRILQDSLAVAQARFPAPVAVHVAVDPEQIDRALREARIGLRRAELHRGEIQIALRREQSAQRAEAAEALREAQRSLARSRRTVQMSMAHGAAGMLNGARQMEQGAERMERTGTRLRTDRAYREQKIEEARRRGETVTHEELIEAGAGLIEGARGMRDGAREMREAAGRMRAGRS